MTSGEREKIMDVLGAVMEIYGRTLSPQALLVFVSTVDDLPVEGVLRALAHHQSEFPPTPGSIRKFLLPSSDDAFERLDRDMKRVGRYRSITWGNDPALMAAVESMGGWVECCGLEWDEWQISRFRKSYESAATGGASRRLPLYFPGLVEVSNRKNGYRDQWELVISGGDEGEIRKRIAAQSEGEAQASKVLRLVSKGDRDEEDKLEEVEVPF